MSEMPFDNPDLGAFHPEYKKFIEDNFKEDGLTYELAELYRSWSLLLDSFSKAELRKVYKSMGDPGPQFRESGNEKLMFLFKKVPYQYRRKIIRRIIKQAKGKPAGWVTIEVMKSWVSEWTSFKSN